MPNEPVVTFGAGPALYALPIAAVVEILDAAAPTPLPCAPPALLGLTDRRGVPVPTVDFARLAGVAPTADDARTRVLVLRLEEKGGRVQTVGLRVERVEEVASLDPPGPAPLVGTTRIGWDGRIVEGIGRRNGRFVTVLRADGLFGDTPPAAVLGPVSAEASATDGAP